MVHMVKLMVTTKSYQKRNDKKENKKRKKYDELKTSVGKLKLEKE